MMCSSAAAGGGGDDHAEAYLFFAVERGTGT